MKNNFSRKQWAGYGFILPSAIMMLVLVAYPILYGFYVSMFDTNLMNRWDFVGLKYYWEALTKPDFLEKIWITVKFTVLVLIGNFVIGILLALLLNMKLKGRTFFRLILILPWLFPEVVVALLWKWMFDPIYGLVNHVLMTLHLINEPIAWLSSTTYAMLGVVFVAVWKGYPLVLIFVLAGLQAIDEDMYEAADIDGAGKLKSFWYITLPSLKVVLASTLILETIWWFKHFTIIHLLTEGGPVNSTSVVSIDIFKLAFTDFRFGQAAALSIIVFLICLLISFAYRRLLSDGRN
ncbi:carbohydrate ABC transporter permease [Paenibacillus nasutitermitis]|uniref:ABC transporter permease n=1 Tax=Paenibacillus nasutitermitis TaxID=1652958 RepID=A0A916Z5Q2_9BACL|nr:sugar ABC transporter permease [Paenibacillus nasutitermitis]GGD76970.1 ABC transporter permease [Paenibacillus nasutitermitis]